jgi:hypothetical protein
VRRLLIVGIAAGFILAAGAASAAVVLDQSDLPQTGIIATANAGGLDLVSSYALGQTFTVGIAGTLDHIDMGLFNFGAPSPNDLTFQVLGPANNVLYSRSVSHTEIPVFGIGTTDWSQLFSFNVRPAGIAVTQGEVLKAIFTVAGQSQAPNASLLNQINNGQVSYAGGDGVAGLYGGYYPTGVDFAFRTYVDNGAAGTPEPGTWALMILGFGAAGTALRDARRRRVAPGGA